MVDQVTPERHRRVYMDPEKVNGGECGKCPNLYGFLAYPKCRALEASLEHSRKNQPVRDDRCLDAIEEITP